MKRPKTTLFLNMSIDGKISTGDNDSMDTCINYPKIKGIKEGYKQYYDIEQTTDLHSLNSARVLTKSHNGKSINDIQNFQKTIVNFIVIDNKPHLTIIGIKNLIQKSKKLYLITTNKNHPVFSLKTTKNLEIIYYKKKIDFVDLFNKFKTKYNIESITIQTGGTLNSIFLRNGLIDKLQIIIIPALIGGKNTSTLIDGNSLHSFEDLIHIKVLKLKKVEQLKHSYLQLKYDVINNSRIN